MSEIATRQCVECGGSFQVVMEGRWYRKLLCDSCVVVRERRNSQQRCERIKLRPGETAQWASSVMGLSIRTEGATGKIMGVTAQRVHQIERTALLKLRSNPYLKWWWLDFKGETPEWPCPVRPSTERSYEQHVAMWSKLALELRRNDCAEEAAEIEQAIHEFQGVWEQELAKGTTNEHG